MHRSLAALCHVRMLTSEPMNTMLLVQVSMSGISVSEDAVNLFYYMKAKSTVRPASCGHVAFPSLPQIAIVDKCTHTSNWSLQHSSIATASHASITCVNGTLLVAAHTASRVWTDRC